MRPEPEGAAFKLNWLRGKTADQEGSASTSEEVFFGVSIDTIERLFRSQRCYLVEPKINNGGGGQVSGQVWQWLERSQSWASGFSSSLMAPPLLRRTLLATAIVDVKGEACFWGIRIRHTRTKAVTTVGAEGAEGSRKMPRQGKIRCQYEPNKA